MDLSQRFEIYQQLGEGSFSKIYQALDKKLNIEVALKVEKEDKHKKILRFEYEILKHLQGLPHVPKIYEFIENSNKNFIFKTSLGFEITKNINKTPNINNATEGLNFIIMELLGKNIANYKKSNTSFNTLQAYIILVKMLDAIEDLHDNGYIHRDIKPTNFVVKESNEASSALEVFMIDYGLAKIHLDKYLRPIPPRQNTDFRGTLTYASLNAHYKKELSRRDDLWSFFFVILDLINENLPWRTCKDDKDDIKRVKEICLADPEKKLFLTTSKAKKEIHEIFVHINSLKYFDRPNYYFIRSKLMELRHQELTNLNLLNMTYNEKIVNNSYNPNIPKEKNINFEKYNTMKNILENNISNKNIYEIPNYNNRNSNKEEMFNFNLINSAINVNNNENEKVVRAKAISNHVNLFNSYTNNINENIQQNFSNHVSNNVTDPFNNLHTNFMNYGNYNMNNFLCNNFKYYLEMINNLYVNNLLQSQIHQHNHEINSNNNNNFYNNFHNQLNNLNNIASLNNINNFETINNMNNITDLNTVSNLNINNGNNFLGLFPSQSIPFAPNNNFNSLDENYIDNLSKKRKRDSNVILSHDNLENNYNNLSTQQQNQILIINQFNQTQLTDLEKKLLDFLLKQSISKVEPKSPNNNPNINNICFNKISKNIKESDDDKFLINSIIQKLKPNEKKINNYINKNEGAKIMKKKLKPCEINHLLFDKFRKTNYKNQVDSVSRVSKSIKEKNILISKEISKEKIFLIEKTKKNTD